MGDLMQSKLSGRFAAKVRRRADAAFLLKIIAVLTAMLTGAMIARVHQTHGPLQNQTSPQK
jgi:hypothetical protein